LSAQTSPVVRSTFVTVVGWIFIILAGFATLISILQNVMIALVFSAPQMDVHPQADPGFDVMFKVMIGFNVLMVLAFCWLFGWIIKRLTSEDIAREFSAT
jgi:cell division protein FtsX